MSKEKLDYLSHEDVETMDKKMSEFRKKETEEELERIVSLESKKEKSSIVSASPILNAKIETKKEESLYKKPNLFQKISIRFFYTLILSGIAFIIYYFLVK